MAKRKVRITMLLDPEILAFFKRHATRPGAEPYQTQINRLLREHVARLRRPVGSTLRVAARARPYGRARGQRTIKAVIRPGEESGWVAECVEVPVVTQGATLDEVATNLREAVGLHLADEDLAALGLSADPTVVATLELSPANA